MRKAIVTTLGLLIVVALGLMINPTARDEIHWRRASHNNDVTSYESYMKTWPHGRHITEAKEKLEFLHWKNALAANTIKGFEQYVQLRPDGKFVAEAKRKAAALRNDLAPFEAALKTGSEDSLKAFLSEFPGHVKWTEAQQILKEITEGRDIVDLLKEKKIEVKTEGSDIESVSLSVRRRVPYPLTVRIPVGTYFVSDNPSTQNMVATEETKIELSNDDWTYESIPAACANRTKEIPSSDDRFTIRRSPHQSELAKLISFLAKAGVPYAVRQAAVWIVTDDADYDDLGILVERPMFQPFGGERVIGEYEAALALKILDKAGINIKQKSIWRDRKRIISGLKDRDLKAWLKQKE